MSETAAPQEQTFEQQVEHAQQIGEQIDNTPDATPEPEQQAQTVPHAALHEERKRRQELQRQVEQTQAQALALQQQQIAMMQYMQGLAQPHAPPPPDPAADPIGHTQHEVVQTRQEVQALRQQMAWQQQAQAAQAAQANQVQRFAHAVNSSEAEYIARTPDYYDALNHLRHRKVAEYVAAGLDEQSAVARLQQDAVALAAASLQRGENPAERAYEIAKTFGYQPKVRTDAQKLEMQAQGQRASTPSGAGGGAGTKVSLDALAKMKGSDFLAATAGEKWKRLVGNLN